MVSEFWGEAHCGWQSARFLALTRDGETVYYARDPSGALPREYFLSGEGLESLGIDPDRVASSSKQQDKLESVVEKGAVTFLVLDLDAKESLRLRPEKERLHGTWRRADGSESPIEAKRAEPPGGER